MGTNTYPFIGMGFMLCREDMDPKEFDILYEDLVEMDFPIPALYHKNLAVATDSYCGEWIFIGEWTHGDEEGIVKMPSGFLRGNGDDIDLELKRQLGEDHPFLKHASFGVYFGTDWT